MKIQIPIIVLIRDGGDGSQTVRLYNNEEELLNSESQSRGEEVTMDHFDDDPYEYGYLETGELRLVQKEDGSFVLDSSGYNNYYSAG